MVPFLKLLIPSSATSQSTKYGYSDKQGLRMKFLNSANNYIDNLIDNIEKRFHTDFTGALNQLNTVLNRACLPQDSSIMNYGKNASQ